MVGDLVICQRGTIENAETTIDPECVVDDNVENNYDSLDEVSETNDSTDENLLVKVKIICSTFSSANNIHYSLETLVVP